ncbi:unnamed protein product [Psylliodes chrysocephalus]|uniref:endo-polygalacturonase n=1 Tax=Psylliodes chrysocephalus TaxID=3402493 RepID=A0A9P0GCW3_9CUCU|nr:unnamed protein product [Psylliodes chrysocephala]
MFNLCLLAFIFALTSAQNVDPRCKVTKFSQVASAVGNCTDIVLNNLVVPAGETLELYLKRGATVTFEGITLFEHTPWSGPLIRVKGQAITVQGAPGSLLNGQGELYWDHIGDFGPKKPQFMKIEASEDSVFRNLNVLNCPHHCIYIGISDRVTLTGWIIDNSYGDHNNFTGHNTDGFDVSGATNLIIENSQVINQDDCVAIRHGANILVRNMYCSGGHGISISVGFSYFNYTENTLYNVTVQDSVIVRSANGIHLKTHSDAYKGEMKNITYKNIYLSGLQNYAINVQQDYVNGSATGIPSNNIPIHDFNLMNIVGTFDEEADGTLPVYINCGKGSCDGWNWSGVELTGATNSSFCNNYEPKGYPCLSPSE